MFIQLPLLLPTTKTKAMTTKTRMRIRFGQVEKTTK